MALPPSKSPPASPNPSLPLPPPLARAHPRRGRIVNLLSLAAVAAVLLAMCLPDAVDGSPLQDPRQPSPERWLAAACLVVLLASGGAAARAWRAGSRPLPAPTAEADWQRRFSVELARRDGQALDCLQQVAASLVGEPLSPSTLARALRLLAAGLGAETAVLQLSPAMQASLHCPRAIASHHLPTSLADGTTARSLAVPLMHGDERIALLVAEAPADAVFGDAQRRLTQTAAMLMALALAGLSRGQEERRGALLEERAAIARELHDSLAQSLAFLKIQVARLQAALRAAPAPDPAATETASQLRDGVSSAYRQVKELIAAFRVRFGQHGLVPALEDAVEEFSQRSALTISLDCRLDDSRLSVNEEFHVLQVMREALSNTVRHARAAHVAVSLVGTPDGTVVATVDDDGRGFAAGGDHPTHYGLSIMRERAASLGGELAISAREGGGTRVCLRFVPDAAAPERTAGTEPL